MAINVHTWGNGATVRASVATAFPPRPGLQCPEPTRSLSQSRCADVLHRHLRGTYRPRERSHHCRTALISEPGADRAARMSSSSRNHLATRPTPHAGHRRTPRPHRIHCRQGRAHPRPPLRVLTPEVSPQEQLLPGISGMAEAATATARARPAGTAHGPMVPAPRAHRLCPARRRTATLEGRDDDVR
jgi:hypothetical protein